MLDVPQLLLSENRNLREAVSAAFKFEGIAGTAQAMRRLIEQATQLARVDITVRISGESGTGKEVSAKAIHFNGARNGGPFVAINCGAIPCLPGLMAKSLSLPARTKPIGVAISTAIVVSATIARRSKIDCLPSH